MATQEGLSVSYIVEQSRDISTYNKLMKVTQQYLFDEELKQRIQNLPDDMIRVIKEYVINPYKFMEELKLYKPLKYVWRWSELYDVHYLARDYYGAIRRYQENTTVNLLNRIKRNTVDYNDLKLILKDLQIKGRTKMIKYKSYDNVKLRQQSIIQAILKQEY